MSLENRSLLKSMYEESTARKAVEHRGAPYADNFYRPTYRLNKVKSYVYTMATLECSSCKYAFQKNVKKHVKFLSDFPPQGQP